MIKKVIRNLKESEKEDILVAYENLKDILNKYKINSKNVLR